MDATSAGSMISYIGVWVQAGGSTLLLLLFYLLTRHAGVRPYFIAWTWCWLALLAALAAVVTRHVATPSFGGTGLLAYSLHAGYFFAKLLHFALIAAGTWLFCRGTRPPGHPIAWVGVAAAMALVGTIGARDLSRVMVAQQPVAVLVYGMCAWLMMRLPAGRRTMGTRFTGLASAGLALLWLVYGVVFWHNLIDLGPAWSWTQLPSMLNSYIDGGTSALLGFGMVVILLEDAQHDAEEARAERLRAVADSEDRLRAVIETATDGIIAADPEGRIVLANAGAARLFGERGRDLAGMPLLGFFDEAVRPELVQRLGEVHQATAGQLAAFQVLGRTTDGRKVPLEVAASRLTGAEPLDILVVRDLSERRRAETERDQLQARLSQSVRMEALGRLVSGVAHELNNPLAAILTFSEQLLAEHTSNETAGPLGTIREQARRARAIVRDLLTFVRRREERREEADLHVLVDRTVRALETDLERQSVRLTVELEQGLPPLTCDPPAVEQVLTNLLDNAARAAPGGTVHLRISSRHGGLSIEVEDSGPGIPPAHLARIFEPFFTTRGTGEGTGLGLSVSLGIVQQHGGELWAENRDPGPGARFSAWLPFGAPTAPGARQSGRWKTGPEPTAKPGGRLLIIDDEPSVRASLRRYFERRGWRVEEAAEGTAGLAKLLATRPGNLFDLVICDLRMPGLSGKEVHQWLSSARPELLSRLVFASGDTASPETASFLNSIPCPVLEKPFELSELAAVVSRVCGDERAGVA
jgi:two-component system NtrC family sensor kinase